ncbi:alpha/beta hydrolase [Pseudooceanicola sp. MF1-13]|uniref:alpha/beta hydrolase n=1 Tax=Pseudooceanicola sp. MF1-13 TaxID=3379095 RepID=UPI003891CD04
MPEGAVDIVVLVPGSGPTDRDGNSAQTKLSSDSYRLLAQGLVDQGIACLRVDKRGMFGSADAVEDANAVTLSDYADDLTRWADFASTLAPNVWLAGHSEGGLVAMLAAPAVKLAGLVLLAVPGRPAAEIVQEQLATNPANAPYLQEVSDIMEDLAAGRRRDMSAMSESLCPLFRDEVQGYWCDLLSANPTSLAGAWQGPALIVQGDADRQVSTVDADALAAALIGGVRLDLPGAGHMLKAEVDGDPLASYRDPTLPIHPDLVPGIARFIRSA